MIRLHAFWVKDIAQHDRISAAVMAFTLGHIKLLRVLACQMQLGPNAFFARMRALAAKDAVDLDMLVNKLALGALEPDLKPFPRRIGRQRVIGCRARAI